MNANNAPNGLIFLDTQTHWEENLGELTVDNK